MSIRQSRPMRRQHWIVSTRHATAAAAASQRIARVRGRVARERGQRERTGVVRQAEPWQRAPACDDRHEQQPHHSLDRALRNDADVMVLLAARANDHRTDAKPVRGDRQRDDEQRVIAPHCGPVRTCIHGVRGARYIRSMIAAMPCPPPMHIVMSA